MAERQAIIIGGGITGLTLASRMARAGIPFVLLEPDEFGGVIQTSFEEGFTLEQGPQVYMTKTGFTTLVEDLGLEDNLIFPTQEPYRQQIWFGDQVVDVPKQLKKVLSSPVISLATMMRVAGAVVGIRPCRPQAEDETVRTFLGRIFGVRFVDTVVAPALQGIYGGDVAKLSARSLFPGLWEHCLARGRLAGYKKVGGKKRICLFKGGGAALVQTLLKQIPPEMICKDRAAAVTWDESLKKFCVQTGASGSLWATDVYIATAGHATASFLEPLDSSIAGQLRELNYTTLIMVQCAVPRGAPVPENSFGVLFPPSAGSDLMGVMFNSELFPHLAPASQQVITCCVGGLGKESLCEKEDQFLAAYVTSELAQRLGLTEVKFLRANRWPKAIPQFELGHHKLVSALHAVQREFPGLRFIGSDHGGIGIPDRMQVAYEVPFPADVQWMMPGTSFDQAI